jgi:hypothetical protein
MNQETTVEKLKFSVEGDTDSFKTAMYMARVHYNRQLEIMGKQTSKYAEIKLKTVKDGLKKEKEATVEAMRSLSARISLWEKGAGLLKDNNPFVKAAKSYRKGMDFFGDSLGLGRNALLDITGAGIDAQANRQLISDVFETSKSIGAAIAQQQQYLDMINTENERRVQLETKINNLHKERFNASIQEATSQKDYLRIREMIAQTEQRLSGQSSSLAMSRGVANKVGTSGVESGGDKHFTDYIAMHPAIQVYAGIAKQLGFKTKVEELAIKNVEEHAAAVKQTTEEYVKLQKIEEQILEQRRQQGIENRKMREAQMSNYTDNILKTLEKEANTYKLTEKQMLNLELVQNRVHKDVIKLINKRFDAVKKLEEQERKAKEEAKAREKEDLLRQKEIKNYNDGMKQDAEKLNELHKKPSEAYKEQLMRLKELYQHGLVNDRVLDKESKNIVEKFKDDIFPVGKNPQTIQGRARDSASVFDSIYSNKNSINIQQRQASLLKDIATYLRDGIIVTGANLEGNN